jgi:hypothetical protein
MSNRCSHGTYFHFSLQGLHLNSCYFHQDLHEHVTHYLAGVDFHAHGPTV